MILSQVLIDPANLLPPEITEWDSFLFDQQVLRMKMGGLEITASAEQMKLIADKINEQLASMNKRKGVA